MIPRPTWFRFLCAYCIQCFIALLIVALVMGVPLVLIAAYAWHK